MMEFRRTECSSTPNFIQADDTPCPEATSSVAGYGGDVSACEGLGCGLTFLARPLFASRNRRPCSLRCATGNDCSEPTITPWPEQMGCPIGDTIRFQCWHSLMTMH